MDIYFNCLKGEQIMLGTCRKLLKKIWFPSRQYYSLSGSLFIRRTRFGKKFSGKRRRIYKITPQGIEKLEKS